MTQGAVDDNYRKWWVVSCEGMQFKANAFRADMGRMRKVMSGQEDTHPMITGLGVRDSDYEQYIKKLITW